MKKEKEKKTDFSPSFLQYYRNVAKANISRLPKTFPPAFTEYINDLICNVSLNKNGL